MALSKTMKRVVLKTAATIRQATEILKQKKALKRQKIAAVRKRHAEDLKTAESVLTKALSPFFEKQVKAAISSFEKESTFSPREWDGELIARCLPVMAKTMGDAMISELEAYGINAQTLKSTSRLLSTKASTASEWIDFIGGEFLQGETISTPLGDVDFTFMTEYPEWMKKAIQENLEETFSQEYWKGINDTTFGDINHIIQKGAEEGWSVETMAKEMSSQFIDDGRYPMNRGRLIARTELGHALNGARSMAMDALIEEVGGELPMRKQWLSVLGTTTRDTHANLDGVPADKDGMWTLGKVKCRWPGDVVLPAEERCNCFPSGVLVSGELSVGQKASYAGQIVKVVTAQGSSLTVTPNHPILTNRGWVAASKLNRTDKVASYRFDSNPRLSSSARELTDSSWDGRDEVDDKPPTVENVFESLRSLAGVRGIRKIIRTKVDDFYGDGRFVDGDIYIVVPNLSLLGDRVPDFLQESDDRNLSRGDMELSLLPRGRSFELSGVGIDGPSTTGPCVGGPPGDGFRFVGTVTPTGFLSVGIASDFDPRLDKSVSQNATTDPMLLCNSLERDPGLVFFDEVVEIQNLGSFSGHVYDFQSKTGILVASDPESNNGIITSNCQCSIVMAFGMDDAAAADLISQYTDRMAKKKSVSRKSEKSFCPTGPGGGVDPTCSPGQSKIGTGKSNALTFGVPQKDNGDCVPGSVGGFAGVDTSWMKQGSADANWALKKIARLEYLASKGKWKLFDKELSKPKSANLSKYQKAILKVQENLATLKTPSVLAPPAGSIPVTPAQKPPVASGENWKKVGESMGTEKGGVYEMGGKKYYVKTPDNPARAKNEVLACRLYALAGGSAVKADLVQIDGKTAYATEMLDLKKANWNDPDVKQKAHEDFAIHAWLNNRDAIGAGSENPMDNIKVKGDGSLILVDAGGSLDQAGMGGGGTKDFGVSAMEWHTMRSPATNPSMAKVFQSMTAEQLINSAKKLESVKDEDIEKVCQEMGRPGLIHVLKERKKAILTEAKLLEINYKKKNPDPDPADNDLIDNPWEDPENANEMAADYVAETLKVKPSLPPAPIISAKSYQPLLNPKIQAIQNAIAAGDVKAVEKVKIAESSKDPYYQKVASWKAHVLAAMKGDSPPSPGLPQKSPPPAAKINPSSFPAIPSFMSSNKALVDENNATAAKMLAAAKDGDLPKLKASVSTGHFEGKEIKSPKLKTWLASVTSDVEEQLAPKAAPMKISGTLKEVADKVGNPKGKSALKKIGKWQVLGEMESLPDVDIPKIPVPAHIWEKGNNAFKKLDSTTQSKIEAYTGSSYAAMNESLRSNKPSPSALAAANGVMEASIPIPEGLKITRNHASMGSDSIKPGHVVADKAILSTSTGSVFSGFPVHWDISIGPGVKGLPAKKFSMHSSEDEILLPPNQRFLVTGVTKNGGKTVVKAIALPTLDNQCCPP